MNKLSASRFTFVLLCMPSAAFAQTSELYLSDWQTPVTYVVQNGSIVRQFNRSATSDGPGLIVRDIVMNIGQDSGNVGQDYSLVGTPLGGSNVNPRYTSLYDGATDGTRNWSIAHNDFATNFAVVVADADWTNMQILFVPTRRSSGITYDANTGTLWITNNLGGVDRVQQFDDAGNFLFEFNAVHSGGGYGIAWDAADDTLWIPGAFGTGGQLFQYDKNGNLLQAITVPGLGPQILGAEFAMGDRPCDPCDMNCDGSIDAFDIEPFLDLLFGPGQPCNFCTGDVNGDGVIDAFDIEPFLNCLFP